MDKEYVILHAIEQDQNITQRELSSKTQISLGSVNLLVNKMVKEGLIKINQIPMNRVAYMLTPKGMLEKINKTSTYIKYHYNYINETKEKIREQIIELTTEKQKLYIVLEGDEISELVKFATSDMKDIHYIESRDDIGIFLNSIKEDFKERKIAVLNTETFETLKGFSNIINLLEKI
ncbi:winged helix-turn-helix transcriptional regulator [Cellulosilyticum sp. I15G10I2]|uniref:winged helix-turn-helix transcriptional regulator n=1 Tax=Cellulosilyticum sp. I15G10I2 TaxID=1892843 RepID=UPI00085C883E|nr:winged helix-turn-helix transcriptional regulator [Cellulosilyticum sp. I15G10I2]